MKKTRRWLLVPLLAVPAYLAVRWVGGGMEGAKDEPPAVLFDRVWMEKIPDEPTDYLHGVYALEAQPVGLFHRSSAFDFHIELFQYDRDGKSLKLTFPQTNKSAKLSFTIKGCDELPPFDLCLTINDNPWGGPKNATGFMDSEDEAKALPGMRETLASRASTAPAMR